jgi:hypothetical protein
MSGHWIAAITLAYLPLTACTRFRLPIDAFWILLASVAMSDFVRKFDIGWRCR